MEKKITVGELELGMYVSGLDRPWLETPFLTQGFPIEDPAQIEQLKQFCTHVLIDTERAAGKRRARKLLRPRRQASAQPAPLSPAEQAQAKQARSAFVAEFKHARQVYKNTRSYIGDVMEDVRLGRSVDTAVARTHVNHIVDSIFRNASALVLLTHLKDRDQYTSLHCLNVCILTVAFGRHLNMGEQELKELGLGALLHDIGKVKVPLEILNKPGPLTAAEMRIIKQHPLHGLELLQSVGGIAPNVLDAVCSHHERADGSGYPHGLKSDQISLYAGMVAIVDMYDAISSDRAYHVGVSPHETLSIMYESAAKNFDPELFQEFIRCLGIFPVGSVVELNTGEVGVVMTVNRVRQLRPIVMLVLDPEKRPYARRRLVNLDLQTRNPLQIKRILESSAHDLKLARLLRKESY